MNRKSGLCNKFIICVALLFFLGAGLGFASETSSTVKESRVQSSPTTSVQLNSQIERGRPNVLLDSTGNVLSLPQKIILLNPKIDSHHISPKTEEVVREFLTDNPNLNDVKVRMNQATLFGDIERLIKNDKVEWYWRIFPGVPVTVLTSLTGRLFGGDHYNPFTNTIHLFSDDPAIALHELCHAKDFAENPSPGLYAVGRIIPGVDLCQEYAATEEAIYYLKRKGNQKQELKAYNVLYPAYGTYWGGYSGMPFGNVLGAGVGHVVGAYQRYQRNLDYEVMRQAKIGAEKIVELDLLGKNLIRNDRETRDILYQALVGQDK